jgi:hypothetical protein
METLRHYCRQIVSHAQSADPLRGGIHPTQRQTPGQIFLLLPAYQTAHEEHILNGFLNWQKVQNCSLRALGIVSELHPFKS